MIVIDLDPHACITVTPHDHTPGLGGFAVEHYHEVVVPDYPRIVTRRDRLGRKATHPTTEYIRVICNNPGCPYEALVDPCRIAQACYTTPTAPQTTPT